MTAWEHAPPSATLREQAAQLRQIAETLERLAQDVDALEKMAAARTRRDA